MASLAVLVLAEAVLVLAEAVLVPGEEVLVLAEAAPGSVAVPGLGLAVM